MNEPFEAEALEIARTLQATQPSLEHTPRFEIDALTLSLIYGLGRQLEDLRAAVASLSFKQDMQSEVDYAEKILDGKSG